MKTTIAIIGTGNRGQAWATGLAKAGNRVLLYAPDSETAKAVSEAICLAYPGADIEAMTCSFEAAWEADIIVLAIPPEDCTPVARYIKDVATQKIIVNAVPAAGTTDELCGLLPHSKIVRVAVDASISADQTPGTGHSSYAVTGNDPGAVETIAQLVETIRF